MALTKQPARQEPQFPGARPGAAAEEEVPAPRPWWREPVWGLILLLVLAALGALVIWGRPAPFADPATAPVAPTTVGQQPHSSPEQIIPTFAGTVERIDGGYLYLRDVTYSLKPGDSKPDATTEKLPVPDGRWVTTSHWESTDGTVNLFRGQGVTFFIESKVIMPALHFIHGRVTAAQGDHLTVQVQEIEKEAGESPQSVVTHVGQDVSLNLTPHAKAGDKAGRTVKAGDQLIIGWFGDSDTQLVWQMTFLN